jgi:hypothetical protein
MPGMGGEEFYDGSPGALDTFFLYFFFLNGK